MQNELFIAAFEEGQGETWNVPVYLVNPTDEAFTIVQKQGAFAGDTDGLLDLGGGYKNSFTLKPKSYHRIDKMTDEGELDFTTWYHFYVVEGERIAKKLFGQVSGHNIYWSRQVDELPIIGKRGAQIELYPFE